MPYQALGLPFKDQAQKRVVSIKLFFALELFVFVQKNIIARLELSFCDVIVSQKRFQWRKKVAFLCGRQNLVGGTIILLAVFAQKYI